MERVTRRSASLEPRLGQIHSFLGCQKSVRRSGHLKATLLYKCLAFGAVFVWLVVIERVTKIITLR